MSVKDILSPLNSMLRVRSQFFSASEKKNQTNRFKALLEVKKKKGGLETLERKDIIHDICQKIANDLF